MQSSDYQQSEEEGRTVNRVSNRDMEKATGVGYQQWQRWRTQGGIPFWQADRVAVKLGLHPAFIWRMDYWRAWHDSAEIFEYELEASNEKQGMAGVAGGRA